ncbi:MAG: PhzF family phenazine biosynthesis protein [Solobacterium sp.]|nr:PhzF family phenazine biosynthesis protein [Solobacterium sp.]
MKQYIVDAFTDQLFKGNQAAVCVMEEWPDEELMMHITKENNFSETAFTVKQNGYYDLRWFTPGGEINLCGHATLATSYVLFRFYEQESEQIIFHTLSGNLYIGRRDDYIVMDFPTYACKPVPLTKTMEEVFGKMPKEAYLDRDLLLVYDDEDFIRNVKPDFEKMKELQGAGISITAKGKEYDCVSRFFAPELSINEDPVTGSVHCMIAPYWREKLHKNEIHAYQASERGGAMTCTFKGDRVVLAGKAVLFAISEILYDL